MVQRQQLLQYINEDMQIPMTAEGIFAMLRIAKEEESKALELLAELEQTGEIIKTRKNRYASLTHMGVVVGTFVGHERGFGFLVSEQEEDVFIPAEHTSGALHGDMVMAKITTLSEGSKKREGEVVKIITSCDHKIVGRYRKEKQGGIITPVNRRYGTDFFVKTICTNGAQHNDMVIAKLAERGTGQLLPMAEITEIIGNFSAPGVDILSVLESRNIPHVFDKTVSEQADFVAHQDISAQFANRTDFRNEQIITIDGDDAKDLDDAVHVKVLPNGNFQLGVHIADVGHYVTENSAIDQEAYRRGTSIYLADRVVPMLPVTLSNGVCSLNEGEDRLTLSVIMEIDQSGTVVNHEITEGIICSQKRMTYSDVTEILTGNTQKRACFMSLVPMLEAMEKLHLLLRKKRVARGSIDFNFDEARIVLDENGKPIDIVKRERGVSNQMIESFMLICNETVAEHMFWLNIPLIYRVHEEPEPDAILEFVKFIASMGYHIKHSNGKVHPRELAELIRTISGTKEEMVISQVALRSLMKARYSHENLGHFGLASKYYCHFTSPIRRYPDLAIHRIIKDCIKGKSNIKRLEAYVQHTAKHASERELEAIETERFVEDMKKAEFMQARIGAHEMAIVTGVTPFGIFATLDNTIEGLIRLADMRDDYYLYDEQTRSICGERNNKRYQIGDNIRICVANADASTGKIDFVLDDGTDIKAYKKQSFAKKKAFADARKKSARVQTAKYLKKKRKKR